MAIESILPDAPSRIDGLVIQTERSGLEPQEPEIVAIPHDLPVTSSLNGPYEELLTHILFDSAILAGTSVAQPFVSALAEFRPGGSGSIELLKRPRHHRLGRTEVLAQLRDMLDEQPVEPGEVHGAEELLAAAAGETAFEDWLDDLVSRNDKHLGSIILLLGRLPETALPKSKVQALLEGALRDARISVREAATRAAETLGDVGLAALRQHDEQVGWLASYIRQVVRDLESGT